MLEIMKNEGRSNVEDERWGGSGKETGRREEGAE